MYSYHKKENQKDFCKNTFDSEYTGARLEILGWRNVPVDKSVPGEIAAKSEPKIEQVFIKKPADLSTTYEFNVNYSSLEKLLNTK